MLRLKSKRLLYRGLDIISLEDWMRHEARGETSGLGLSSAFYPMWRIERIERDESTDELEGLTDRFLRVTGRRFVEAAGVSPRRKKR